MRMIFLFVCAVCAITFGVARAQIAIPADDWSELFNRRNGWTGADGIFTANLDGTINSGIEKRHSQKTFFVFSDTILGDVDPQTLVRRNVKMVNHSFAILDGSTPRQDRIVFFYPEDGVTPRLPIKPPSKDEWYWISECFVIGDQLHAFLLRMEKCEGGAAFGFRHLGVDRATWKIDAKTGVDWESLRVTRDDPFAPHLAVFSHDHTVSFGTGVLENTDGFVYVYGYREGEKRPYDRALVALRFRPDEIDVPTSWRYWTGSDWSASMRDAVGIVPNVSTELSVTPIESGPAKDKYALVYTPGTIGSKIAVRLGATPVGPFGDEIIVFDEEETKRLGGKTFAYNAKAHPVLSKTGELVVSYNINSMDSEMRVFKEGGVYHPRFVSIPLEKLNPEQ
ncbi:MAG: DUF4185 domain-containing protein [Thermoguttaceae bacterium]